MQEDYPHTEQLPAEVLKLPPHFLLAAQVQNSHQPALILCLTLQPAQHLEGCMQTGRSEGSVTRFGCPSPSTHAAYFFTGVGFHARLHGHATAWAYHRVLTLQCWRPMRTSLDLCGLIKAGLTSIELPVMARPSESAFLTRFCVVQYLGQQLSGLPPLRTSSSFGQDSWGSQSMTPSAGEPSISDFIPRPIGAEVRLLQEPLHRHLLSPPE